MARNCNHSLPGVGPDVARRWFLQQCGVGLGAPRIDAIKQSRLQQVRQEVAKRHRERLENQ